MKYLVRIVTPILFIAACFGQSQKSDREIAGFVGPVQAVKGRSVDYTDKINGPGFMNREEDRVVYDESGYEIERGAISDFGEGFGRISRTIVDGRVTSSEWIDAKGKVISKELFAYEKGHLTERRRFNGDLHLVERSVKSYDSEGHAIKEVYYADAKPIARTEFKYDEKGNQIESAFYMADGSKAIAPVGPCLGAHRIVTTFDDRGNVISQTFYEANGKVKRSTKYEYDLIRRVNLYITDNGSSRTTFVYKYEDDSHGNWVKRIATGTNLENGLTVFGGKPIPYVRITVTTREITYY
jgi:hypothetical protein